MRWGAGMMGEELYIMWLSRVKGMTGKKLDALMQCFSSAQAVFLADGHKLMSTGFLDSQTVNHILAAQDKGLLEAYAQELDETGIRFISKFHSDYPKDLRHIQHPPMGLYLLGCLPDEQLPRIGVVGARRCSEYGLTASHKLSKALAAHGVVIVSGMARGIDSQSHLGALEGNGFTIAVLGCGVDVCYPPENRALREEIIKNGCLVSEYPPKTKPIPAYFPARNRIISGLSRAIIVVEAAKVSGTSITVDEALEQGRDVFAVPGNITSKLSEGTNTLIKQGAIPVSNFEDVLDNLGIPYAKEEPLGQMQGQKVKDLRPMERLVYNCVTEEGIALDAVLEQTGLPIAQINATLLILEVADLVKMLPGQRVMKI